MSPDEPRPVARLIEASADGWAKKIGVEPWRLAGRRLAAQGGFSKQILFFVFESKGKVGRSLHRQRGAECVVD